METRKVVFLGHEDPDEKLFFGGVYDWYGDVFVVANGRTMRRFGWARHNATFLADIEDTPYYDDLPSCPACGGDGLVLYQWDINYGPHPDSPEMGDCIQRHEQWRECPECAGTGADIPWNRKLEPQPVAYDNWLPF